MIGQLRRENETVKKRLEGTRQKVDSLKRIIDYAERGRKRTI